jgi:hypothetical protein
VSTAGSASCVRRLSDKASSIASDLLLTGYLTIDIDYPIHLVTCNIQTNCESFGIKFANEGLSSSVDPSIWRQWLLWSARLTCVAGRPRPTDVTRTHCVAGNPYPFCVTAFFYILRNKIIVCLLYKSPHSILPWNITWIRHSSVNKTASPLYRRIQT